MLTWWVICFAATAITVFSKWYFAENISRVRQTLSRQHRETLELKGALQDARAANLELMRQIKANEADIGRSKKRIAELKAELNNRPKPTQDAKKK